MNKKTPISKGKTITPSPPQGGEGRGEGVTHHQDFYHNVAEILRAARGNAYRAVNFAMVEAYWNVGRMIVEEEQQGKERAEYGAFLIQNLAVRLSNEFGRGFSEPSLWNMRQYYQCFPILSALRRELTWTHYKSLIRVENETARAWYLKEAAEQNWSTRVLERQINSLYYERLLMSRDKAISLECGDMSPLYHGAPLPAYQSAVVHAHNI